jgi:hypothetical protein
MMFAEFGRRWFVCDRCRIILRDGTVEAVMEDVMSAFDTALKGIVVEAAREKRKKVRTTTTSLSR